MTERDYSECFSKNNLSTVAFELRFTPLLKIDKSIPDFQEKIRERFPKFTVGTQLVDFRVRDSSFKLEEHSALDFGEFKEWLFSDVNDILTLKISINSISITTRHYKSFEVFFSHLTDVIDAFNSVLSVGKYNRIGLRYINEIPLESGESFSDQILKLFNPAISRSLIKDSQILGIQTLFRRKTDKELVINTRNAFGFNQQQKPVYVLDIDVYKTDASLAPADYKSEIKNLHDLAVKEFHDNVLDEYLDSLRD